MKKVLLLLPLTLALASCSTTTSLGDAIIKGTGILVTNNPDGTGTLDVAVGDKSIRNVAFTLTSTSGLTLTRAPDGADCAYMNNRTQIYCRLGNMTPFTSAQAKFSGVATAAKLGYVDADGKVQTKDATVVYKN